MDEIRKVMEFLAAREGTSHLVAMIIYCDGSGEITETRVTHPRRETKIASWNSWDEMSSEIERLSKNANSIQRP